MWQVSRIAYQSGVADVSATVVPFPSPLSPRQNYALCNYLNLCVQKYVLTSLLIGGEDRGLRHTWLRIISKAEVCCFDACLSIQGEEIEGL